MGNVISVIDALAEEKQTGGNAEPKIMTADLAQSLYAGKLRVPVNANMPRTGAMTNFMYGLIDTADAFVNDTPEQIKILGGQYDVVMGGLKGDEERIKRGRMNMDTANRNLQFNQQQRDMLTPDAAKDTFGYALGSGVASYGTMVIGGYGGSSAAKALGASAKAASRATGTAAYGTMAAMEVGGEVQERADKYVADTGDEEFKNYEPEKALKNLAAESAYGVTSVILEKYLGFGEQRRLFNLDLAKLKSPTLRATASLTKTGVKSAVSEAGTEFAQSLANMGIDLIDGTMDWEQVPDRLKQELTGWAAAAVIGGTAGVGVGIYNRSRGIRAIKEEIRGTVPDADLERTASAIFDSAAEKMADVVSVELELSSQLRNKHGSVMDSMQRAVKQAVDESGAFQDVDEDMLAEYVVDTSKLFADQVLAEANIRNVPIEEVIQASDIVYENGGIRLKSQTEGGESRVLADSSVNVEGERTDFDDKAKKAVAEVFSNPQPVETSVEETTENTVSENNIVAETIAPVLNETAEAPTAEENSISADAATSQEENIATAVLNEETPQIEENDHAEKIEDFDEKIEGARKDLWNGYKEKLSDELPEDKQKIKLSTFFPEPDYETAINNGINIDVLSAVKALHDAMPPKPKKAYKLDKWVESLKNVRLLASKLLNGEIDIKSFDTLLDNGGYVLKPFRQTVETYRILGFPEFTKANGYRIESDIYNFAEGRQLEKPEYRYRVMKGNTPVTRFFNDIQDASDALRDIINNKTSDKKVKLDLYQIRSTGELVIGKKVASGKFIDLKKGFSSIKDAREYMESHEDELIAELERKKTLPKTRREVNETRIGEEYRNGNISPAQFSETFGFRGVQFGNWVEQSRRADDLNRAYDALVDLSKILDVPTRAISLNGTLGLAFGARGTGGKEAAAAHYEPLQVVINLTKEHGAGSLAHEWFHALDNSFGVKTDNDYMSEISFTLSENVRDEVKDAFKNLKRTLEKSGLYERSKERDKTRSKDYWSTGREMAARAFESYIIDKAAERGVKNDYLANIIGEADYNDSDTFAYVKQSEKKEIYAAFDKLFDTLQTRETDNGVEFYQLPQEAYDAQGKADINTPEFKEWFGDSKVVDEKGKPLEMVHFSYNEFSQFDKSHAGVNNDESSIGFWFADRDDFAFNNERYPIRYDVYLKMDNPLIIEGNGTETNPWADTDIDNLDSYAKFEKMFNDLMYQAPQMWDERVYEPIYGGFETRKVKLRFSNFSEKKQREIIKGIIDKLKAQGYDGIIIKNTRVDSLNPDEGINQYVVFEPNQIKSVYNRGTWDARNDNIYYQNAEQVFSPTNRDKNTYISDLRAVERGEDTRIRVGELPIVYRELGLSAGMVRTNKDVIFKDTIGKHDVSQTVVDNLPQLFADPIMVFESSTKENRLLAVVNAQDKNGNQIVVAISPNTKGERGYHFIPSFYGKDNFNNFLNKNIIAGNLKYLKSPQALDSHQLWPQVKTLLNSLNKNILQKSDIVNSFMQQKPQPKGLYDASKGVIKIFESADFSTLPHEIAHYWLDNMWSYVRSGNASEKYRQRWNVIANWLNVKPEQAVLTRGQQEKFARGYEQYLLNGDLPTPIIKGAFDDYDRWLKRVYGDMNRLNVRLSEDVVRFFQSMTTGILPPPRIRPSRKPREKMTTAEKLREQLGLQEQDRQEKETVKLVEEMEATRPEPDSIDARTVIVSNITEGEAGKSRVYSREVERNIDALQEIADVDLDYNKIRLEEQAQRAADFVKNNLEDARKIIDGRKPAPENILDTAIRIAYEQEMLRIGDNTEYLRALKLHSSLQTLRGQEIVAERISTKDIASPTYWINKLVAHRTYKAASKIFKGYAEAVGGDSPVDLYKKMIKNETDRITKKVLAEKTREEQQKVLNAELKRLRYEYGTGVQGELFQMPLEPLNARNAKMYVREALDDIFGTTVSQEEANQIIGKIGEIEKSIVNTLDETGNPSVQTWQKINEMNNLVESLTPSPALQIATSIVGRGMMLSSVKSPVLNVVSNTENILTEMLIRRAVNSLEGGASFSAVDKNVEKDYLAYADDVYRASGYNVSTTEGLDAATVTLGERRISTQGAGKFRAFARGVETGVFKYLMGYPDSRAKDFVFSDTAALEATTIAQNEGLSGEMLSKRATELYRDATRVAPLTEEGMLIREKAMIEANVATYTNDTAFSKFALGIRETLNKVTGNVRLGDQLMPFVKTPANVVALGMEYSIGAAYLIPNLTTVIRDVKAGKLSAKSRTAIKAAVRNGLGVVLAMLIAMALDPDDYTPDYDALTMSERRLALEKNAVFNSIRIGDKYISLDYFGPLAVPLTAVLSARRRGEIAWFGYAKGVASQLQKLPGLQEFSETVDAIGRATSNKPEKTVKNLNNALIDFVRARTIPSIVNDLAKSIDTYERETSAGTYDKAKASIPGIRESLPLKYTTTSKTPRETEPAWSTVLFGARVKTAASNRVIYEIDRLYKKGAKPTITDVTRSGKLSELSEAKQQRVRKEFAKRYYAEVYTLIRTRAYRAKDDEQKAAAINKVRRQIIEQLKKTYIR